MFEELINIQTIDLELEELEEKLKQLNKLLETKGPEMQLEEMKKRLEAYKTLVKEKELKIDKISGEIQITEEKIKVENERLYSGKITRPKELQAIEGEIKSLKKRVEQLKANKEELEKEIFSGKDKISKAGKLVTDFSEKLIKEKKEKLNTKKELESRVESLNKKREKLVEKTKPEHYKLYVSLRERYGGEVIVKISEKACMGCFVELAAKDYERITKLESDISLCPNCGRILVPEKIPQ